MALLHKPIAELSPPRPDSPYSLDDRVAERGVAVQDGDADLEFGDLTVLHNASSSRSGSGGGIHSIFATGHGRETWTPKGLIARHGSSGNGIPELCVLPGRDDGMSTAMCNRIVALARVVGAICRDSADCPVRRNLVEKVG